MENNELPVAIHIPVGSPVSVTTDIVPTDAVLCYDIESNTQHTSVAISEDEYIATLMNEMFDMVDRREVDRQQMSRIYFAAYILKFLGHCLLITFSVLALTYTNPAQVHRLCPDTNAWSCVLLNGVIEMMGLYKTIHERKYKNPFNYFDGFRLTLSMGIYSWTQYEWFSIKCVENLEGNLIYKMLEVDMIIGLIVLCMCFLAIIYFVFMNRFYTTLYS